MIALLGRKVVMSTLHNIRALVFLSVVLAALDTYADPQSPTISPPVGVFSGNWVDSVPLHLVPDQGVVQPRISLVHDKSVNDGILGQSYRLTGTSAIIRTSATRGVPGHTQQPRYTLNGGELLHISGTQHLYTPITQDGSSIRYEPANNSWIVVKDGWTNIYGGNEVSTTKSGSLDNQRDRAAGVINLFQSPILPGGCAGQQGALCGTTRWKITESTDAFGNKISYEYGALALPEPLQSTYSNTQSEPLLLAMRWTDATGKVLGRVEFQYQPKPDSTIRYHSGTAEVSSHRLIGITSYTLGEPYTRYQLQYQDQDGTDCNGRVVDAIDNPARSRLRSILRIAVDRQATKRQLRCIATHNAVVSDAAWGEELHAGVLLADSSDFKVLSVVPTKINDDAKADLLILHKDGNHSVYIASGVVSDAIRPFRALPSDTNRVAWQTHFRSVLSQQYLDSGQGWLVGDFDRDGRVDTIHHDEQANKRILSRYDTSSSSFQADNIVLGRCALKYATTADIDGDGFADLVLRPRAEEESSGSNTDLCSAQTGFKWLRNLGRAPWFDAQDPEGLVRPLRVPYTKSTISLNLPGQSQTLSIEGLEIEPPFGNRRWKRPDLYVAHQVKFGDYNGDGIGDVALSLHRQWRVMKTGNQPCQDDAGSENGRCQWRPVDNAEYSRFFWGDGYGQFKDSDLAAGASTLDAQTLSSTSINYRTNFNAMQDLNRSGRGALLWGGRVLNVAQYRGLQQGFVDPDGDAGLARDYQLELNDRVHNPCPGCVDTAMIPVFADFDGNGFVDILQLQYDPDGFSAPECMGLNHCLTVRFSQQQTADGRVVASDGAWGGRTRIGWTFSGTSSSNAGLRSNIEVLSSTRDINGETTYRYSRGVERAGAFKGFGLVTRTNANGGMEAYHQAVSHALQNKPVYMARYRNDGSLEKLVTFVHGQYTQNAYEVAVRAPYNNPRIRECVFEVERSLNQSIGALIRRCWAWGGRSAPPIGQIAAITGLQVDNSVVSQRAWGTNQTGAASVQLGNVGAGSYLWQPTIATGMPVLAPRWKTDLALPASPDPETLSAAIPSAATGRGFKLYVTDWEINAAVNKPSKTIMHRDVTTQRDDLIETMSWQRSFEHAGVRLIQAQLKDPADNVIRTVQRNDFVGFDSPQTQTNCGTSEDTCRTLERRWNLAGQLQSVVQVEGNIKQQWTQDARCGVVKFVDKLGQITQQKHDKLCRLIREEDTTKIVGRAYDGFHRPTNQYLQPNKTAKKIHTQYLYDDLLSVREDRSYVEPRSGTVVGNSLQLEYLDGFGRTTRRVVCQAKKHATTGDLPYVCDGEDIFVQQWYLYGTDGQIYASAAPFKLKQESPNLTVISARDGLGRPHLTHSPAHVSTDASPAWVAQQWFYAPGRKIELSPTNQVTVYTDTNLRQSSLKNGRLQWHHQMNRLGKITKIENRDEPTISILYDALGRMQEISRVTKEEVYDAGKDRLESGAWNQTFQYNDRDQLRATVYADGSSLQITYDALGRALTKNLVQEDSVLRETWEYNYDTVGNQVIVYTNTGGGKTTTRNDSLGRLQSIEYPDGVVETHDYQEQDNTVTTTRTDGGLNLSATAIYDFAGNLLQHRDYDGRVNEYRYDGAGRVVAATTAGGLDIFTRFTQSGLPIATYFAGQDGNWPIYQNQYDDEGRVLVETNNGVESRYLYDGLGRVRRVTQGKGNERTRTNFGYIATSDLPRTVTRRLAGQARRITRFAYDDWFRMASATDPSGGITKFYYNLNDRSNKQADANGVTSVVELDQLDRVLFTKIQGVTTRYQYTYEPSYNYRYKSGERVNNVQRIEATNPLGASLVTWLDSSGRLIAQQPAEGARTEITYLGSRVDSVFQIAGGNVLNQTSYIYDSLGRRVATLGPGSPTDFVGLDGQVDNFPGYKIITTYDAKSRVTEINAAGERTELEYDDDGLLKSEIYSGLTRTHAYTTPDTNETTPLRVSGYQLVGTDGASTRTVTLDHDSFGRLVRKHSETSDGKTQTVQWPGYDLFDNPILETVASSDGVATNSVVYRWKYNKQGRPVRRTVAIDNQTVGSTLWKWQRNGQLVSKQGMHGQTVSYKYAPEWARIDQILLDSDVVGEITQRDGRGRPTRFDSQENYVLSEWSNDGLVERRSVHHRGGDLRSEWDPSYDALRRISSVAKVTPAATRSVVYTFSPAGVLQSEAASGGDILREIRYQTTVAGLRERTFVNDVLTTHVEYDGPTKVVAVNDTPITYDAWQGVTQDQHGVEYTRDANGQVSRITTADSTTKIIRGPYGVPVAYENTQGQRRILDWGLAPMGLPLSEKGYQGERKTYLRYHGVDLSQAAPELTDQTGTSLAVTAELGISAFGELPGGGAIDVAPFAYANLDRVGQLPVYQARHRLYDAQTGRFLSLDPAGLAGGLHRTLYAKGDPIHFNDPLGLWACAVQPNDSEPINLDTDPAGIQDSILQNALAADAEWDMWTYASSYMIQELQLAAGLSPVMFVMPVDIDLQGSQYCNPGHDCSSGDPRDWPRVSEQASADTSVNPRDKKKQERKVEKEKRKSERNARKKQRREIRLTNKFKRRLMRKEKKSMWNLQRDPASWDSTIRRVLCKGGKCVRDFDTIRRLIIWQLISDPPDLLEQRSPSNSGPGPMYIPELDDPHPMDTYIKARVPGLPSAEEIAEQEAFNQEVAEWEREFARSQRPPRQAGGNIAPVQDPVITVDLRGDAMMSNLIRTGKAFPIVAIRPEYWTPEQLHNWLLNPAFDKPFLTLDAVNGIATISAGGVTFKLNYDALTGKLTYRTSKSKTIGIVSLSGGCDSSGNCSGGANFKRSLGPINLSYDPSSQTGSAGGNAGFVSGSVNANGQGTVFFGPKADGGIGGGKAGVEAKATLDARTLITVLLREYERQTSDYVHQAPNIEDFMDYSNVRIIFDDEEVWEPERDEDDQ